jgi:Ca2+-binding EF-hand superfamily protein
MIVDAQALIKFCHKNGDGSIFFPEFFESLREPLKDRSKKIARRAFNSEGKEDKFQAPEFFVLYNASSQVGKKSRDQIISEIFESMDANNNRRIFKKEFYSYFSDVKDLHNR